MENTDAIKILRLKLAEYCLTQCPAKCCHIGKLFVTKELVEKHNLKATKRDDGNYDLIIEGGCQLLKNNQCSIYTDETRPKICAEYPFFDRGTKIVLASRCPAVESGLFEEELQMITDNHVRFEFQ